MPSTWNIPVGVPPTKTHEPGVVKLDFTATDQVLWNGEAIASKSDSKSRNANSVNATRAA